MTLLILLIFLLLLLFFYYFIFFFFYIYFYSPWFVFIFILYGMCNVNVYWVEFLYLSSQLETAEIENFDTKTERDRLIR